MATNPYISQKVRSEQHLYEDLVIESLKFYGQDVYYIPREIVNKDKIFGDDIPSRFSDAYKIEMYIENTEGFDGEGDLFTKFGIELRDQATFVVARRRWKKLVGENLAENNFRPREGDIIYLPMSESMFEIMKVETETPFYQLSNLPTFRLQAELFDYSDEDFDTDIASIDAVEYEGAFQYKLTMNTSAEVTPTLAPLIDDQGRVTSVTITNGGAGFTSTPTITTSGTVADSKFGTSSLYSERGHGDEGNYLLTNNEGTVEMFLKPSSLPSSGQQALFITGGDSDKNTMMFGINQSGQLVYSYGNNDGVAQKQVVSSIPTGSFTHLLVGHDDGRLFAYVNGSRVLDSASDRPLNFVSSRGYSVGAFAARGFDGINYSPFDGRIDEFRVLVGDKTDIFDSRISHTVQTFTLTIASGNGSDYTFDSGQSDRNGEITDLTDPEINVILGDTLVLDNNTGGHPLEIKDSGNNVVVSTADIIDGQSTFTPTATGTYTYQCTVSGHESMIGNIVVSAQPETSITVPTAEFDSGSTTALLRHFNGDSAQLTAVLTNGSISSVTIEDSGHYYLSAPTATVPASTTGGNFSVGETVTQTNTDYTIKGEVTRWSDSDRILQLAHVGSTGGGFKTFTTTTPIIGASSDAQWVPKLVEELQEIQESAQNKVFDDFEGDFLDFSENNPFGDIF